MNYTIKKETISNFFFPVLIACALFLTAVYAQPFGLIFSIFSPVPIVIVFLQKGMKPCFHILLTVTLLIFILANITSGVVFFFEYGLMAVVLGETISRQYSVEKIITSCVFISILSIGFVILAMFVFSRINLYSVLVDLMSKNFDNAIMLITKDEKLSKGNLNQIIESVKSMKILIISSFPALLTVGAITGSLLNYLATRFIWCKYNKNTYFNQAKLSLWCAPEFFIWILIGSGVFTFIEFIPPLKSIGLNVLIIIALIYYLQGVAIISFYLEKSPLPKFFQGVSILLITTQPLFITITVGLGLFDLWIDFRKIKKIKNNSAI